MTSTRRRAQLVVQAHTACHPVTQLCLTGPRLKVLQVAECVINPMALSQAELFGAAHPATGRWHDGVLAHIMRSACRDKSAEQMWVVLDGPVDARWVEGLDTLLDRSRVLSLLSGERLALPPQVRP